MNGSRDNTSQKKRLKARIYDLGTALTMLYDRSIVAGIAKKLRTGFLTLSTRSIGIFLLTFGAYACLIGTILSLFTEIAVDASSVYGGAICAVSSIPLIFSGGNVSTALTESIVGSVICDHLSVRREALKKSSFSGHLSIAFILGVVMGGATLIFPFGKLICAIAVAVMVCIILCAPESGLTFMVVLAFFAGIRLQYIIIGASAVSYVFKLIRGKRTFRLRRGDILLTVFALATLGGIFITSGGSTENIRLFVLLIPYFMAVLFLRDAGKITRLLSAATVCAGALGALYILGYALSSLLPAGLVGDKAFLIRTVSSMYAFESGFATFAMAALIPVCISFILKPKNEGSRFSLILCIASMLTYLIMADELAFLLAASVASALLLLIAGSRWIYLSVASGLAAVVILFFAGSFGDKLYRYIYHSLYEAYHQAESIYTHTQGTRISAEYLICGNGFSDVTAGSSFYHGLLLGLGIAGVIAFGAFILFVAVDAVKLTVQTFNASKNEEYLQRFASIGNSAETRMGIIAAGCALLSILLCASFFDLYKSPLSYMHLFLLTGICSAYSRSARGELEKAKSSSETQNTKERAHTLISRQHN